jgi:1,2-diacylglycerol 3-alpha-glucosyltransferase
MSVPEIKRICVQWPRLGPYYLARLRATHTFLADKGVELVALETAAVDTLYEWRVESGETPFPRVQVFTDRAFEHISPEDMHRAVQNRLDEIDPDVVAIHTYSFPDSRACLQWCKKNRRTAILMTDSKEDDVPRVWWREFVKSRLIGCFDTALLAGKPQQSYFEKLGFPSDYIFLGYDVVDNDYFAERAAHARSNPDTTRHLPGLDSDDPFFLTSNRFIDRKNLSGLLCAYSDYRKHCSYPWKLVLLGDGYLRPELESQVELMEIEDVVFAGFRQIEDIPSYYGRASAFIHPAFADQWALVVNEAMAASLPVLVSTGAGCVEDLVVERVSGFRFDPADLSHLSHLMCTLSEDEDLQAELAVGANDVISKWTLDRFADSLWKAAQSGSARKSRRLHPIAALLINLLRLAPSTHSFHSVES